MNPFSAVSVTLGALFVVALQAGAVTYLPQPLSSIMIPVIAMVFFATARRTSALFLFSGIAGIGLESASQAPFGIAFFASVCAALVLEFSTRKLIATHTSYARFASTGIGIAGFLLAARAAALGIDLLGGPPVPRSISMTDFLLAIFVNIALVAALHAMRALLRVRVPQR